MASITNGTSTFTFLSLSGELVPPRLVMQKITRPGVAGVAFQAMQHEAPITQHETFTGTTNAASAALLVAMYPLYAGQICSVTDDHGTTWLNCMVIDVAGISRKAVANAVGLTAGAYQVRALWSLQLVGASYP
ncbi:MAG: hypothetical protein AMXMBFR84_37880 [Candidatus Hydrogenedentota bacterium]